MNELIRARGFRLIAVADAIGVSKNTISRWDRNAPIGKLVDISKFTGISMEEIIHCLVDDHDSIANHTDPGGDDNN